MHTGLTNRNPAHRLRPMGRGGRARGRLALPGLIVGEGLTFQLERRQNIVT